jgi:hypothetical protein
MDYYEAIRLGNLDNFFERMIVMLREFYVAIMAEMHWRMHRELVSMVQEAIDDNYKEGLHVEELEIDENGVVTNATLKRSAFMGTVTEMSYCDRNYPEGRKVINAIQVFIDNDPYWGFQEQDGDWVTTRIGNVLRHGDWVTTVERNMR